MSEFFRTYDASGALHYGPPDGSQLVCRASITQAYDGEVHLVCTTPPGRSQPSQWAADLVGVSRNAISFVGTTDDGRPLAATGKLLRLAEGAWDIEKGSEAVFLVTGPGSGVRVGETRLANVQSTWRFALTNLVFRTPNESRPDTDKVLHLRLGPQNVSIEKVPDYKDIVQERLRRRHAIHVTAYACLPGTIDLHVAEEVISDLCSLMSIAQGTLIGWICCDWIIGAGEHSFSFHRPAVTRPYNGSLPLIDPFSPANFRAFVEAVYGRFREIKHERKLEAISRAFADVRTSGFLETRCLQLLSITELIIGRDASICNEATVMPQQTFDRMMPKLKVAVRELATLAFPDLSKADARRLTDHIPGWNHSTFKRKLTTTAKRFGVTLRSQEVLALRETRNALVHRGEFATQNPLEEFQLVASVLDRLLMGLLNYRGPYVDVRNLQRMASISPHAAPDDGSEG